MCSAKEIAVFRQKCSCFFLPKVHVLSALVSELEKPRLLSVTNPLLHSIFSLSRIFALYYASVHQNIWRWLNPSHDILTNILCKSSQKCLVSAPSLGSGGTAASLPILSNASSIPLSAWSGRPVLWRTGHVAVESWFSVPWWIQSLLTWVHSLLFSLQEPLEMKFPRISYSALALMKVRKLPLVEELCTRT